MGRARVVCFWLAGQTCRCVLLLACLTLGVMQKFEGEAILVFADPKMVYGTAGWLVAVEPEAADFLLEVRRTALHCIARQTRDVPILTAFAHRAALFTRRAQNCCRGRGKSCRGSCSKSSRGGFVDCRRQRWPCSSSAIPLGHCRHIGGGSSGHDTSSHAPKAPSSTPKAASRVWQARCLELAKRCRNDV